MAAEDEGTDTWPFVGLLDFCLMFSTSKMSDDDILPVVFLLNFRIIGEICYECLLLLKHKVDS